MSSCYLLLLSSLLDTLDDRYLFENMKKKQGDIIVNQLIIDH